MKFESYCINRWIIVTQIKKNVGNEGMNTNKTINY